VASLEVGYLVLLLLIRFKGALFAKLTILKKSTREGDSNIAIGGNINGTPDRCLGLLLKYALYPLRALTLAVYIFRKRLEVE